MRRDYRWHRIRIGLQARLRVLVTISVLLVGGQVGGMTILGSRDMLRDLILEDSLAVAGLAASYTTGYMGAAQASLRELAGRRSVALAIAVDDPDLVRDEVLWLLQTTPSLDSISVVDLDGQPWLTGLQDPPATASSLADREWFQQAVATGQPYLGLPVIWRGTDRPVVPYAVPIQDDQGRLRGVLAGGISLEALSAAITVLKGSEMARVALLDARQGGVLLIHWDRKRFLTKISGKNAAVVRLLAGESGSMENTSSSGERTLAGFAPVPGLPWGVLIQNPSDAAFGKLDALALRTALTSSAVIAVVLAVAGLLAIRVVRPLARLRRTANELAAGNLSLRLGFSRQDEIGDLGHAFDMMADSLVGQRAELVRRAEDLELARDELEALNATLEARVDARTAEVEARASQLAQSTSEVRDLERHNREMALLNELGELLQACQTAGEATAVLGDFGQQLFPASDGTLALTDSSRQVLTTMSTWGDFASSETTFPPSDCWALRRGRPHFVATGDVHLRCAHVLGPPELGYVCIPMSAQGELLGLLHLHDTAGECCTPAKLRLAEMVAKQAGLALSNLNLRETLRSQSIRDPLTNLFNRRFLTESFEREIRRARRSGQPVAAIVLDIDHFKTFNDIHGHDAGDAVLKSLSHLLSPRVRGEDFVCRLGGEEFVVVLPGASLPDAVRRAEQIGDEVRLMPIMFNGQTLGPITASFGVALFPQHGDTLEAILRGADLALYRAKSEGRDRLVVAARPMAA